MLLDKGTCTSFSVLLIVIGMKYKAQVGDLQDDLDVRNS
jgi:hypothetical protein